MHVPKPIALEQARILYRQAPSGVIFAGTAAWVVASVFAATGRIIPAVALGWMGMMAGCVLFHLWLCYKFARTTNPEPQRWIWRFTVAAGLEGLTWACGAVLLSGAASYDQVLIAALLSTAMASGAAYVFSTDLRPFRAFFYPVMSPYVVIFLVHPHPLSWLLEIMVWIYLLCIPALAAGANRQLMEALRLRFANQELAEDLRRQKELADEANVAKSRFLASASHDLRQPVHALGLFIGALRPRRMDAEARRLVDRIASSVDAMDDLFAALLDISKLDAGAMQPEFQSVAIGPLLSRIARDYMPEADAKGIALRVMPCALYVCADPVLLERMIRNILSNGVRHTSSGRVLIGVRRRGPRLEVRDTGPGIPLAEQERIFDEFYQINNPERDRTKGLGLGLAIVRRIAALTGATVTVRSRPGIGSCFTLSLRAADAASPMPRDAISLPAANIGLILVIDDEAEIRVAMASLLTSWGFRVIVAGSMSEMLDSVAAGGEAPVLIICVYRLRGEADGIGAITGLRAHFGREIPAMLITGDTAPDRIANARASGFVLLHKPVQASRLRAAITNLIRTGQAATDLASVG